MEDDDASERPADASASAIEMLDDPSRAPSPTASAQELALANSFGDRAESLQARAEALVVPSLNLQGVRDQASTDAAVAASHQGTEAHSSSLVHAPVEPAQSQKSKKQGDEQEEYSEQRDE